MASMNNKIHQAGPIRLAELPAQAILKPGMLLEQHTDGSIKPHSTAGGFAEKAFAQEDALQGKVKTDAYAVGDPVQIAFEASGNLGLGLLESGHTYAIGTQLISAGNGKLKPTTGTPKQIIATCLEVLDLSDSDALDTLADVRYY